MTTIQDNLNRVREKIDLAALRSGRSAGEITLVGVTKTQPIEVILEVLEAGVQHLGENRVEELGPKRRAAQASQLANPSMRVPVWHMIGHIQSRKAAEAADSADVIHSLDSAKLAHRLEEWVTDRVLPVMIEVNLSGEAAKYGWPAGQWDGLCRFVEDVTESCPHLSLCGLMTMAPWVPDTEVVRPVFAEARRLRDRLAERFPDIDWRHLSMGMTDDYLVAIEEGSTMVRIGRAIFGERRR